MDSSSERLGHDWNKFRDYINLINKLENLGHIIFVNCREQKFCTCKYYLFLFRICQKTRGRLGKWLSDLSIRRRTDTEISQHVQYSKQGLF